MLEHLGADESFPLLVFVCVPLLLLLIAAIVLRIRFTPLSAFTFSTFSLTVDTVGHGEAFVTYSDKSKKLSLDATTEPGERFFATRISVKVPRELPNEQIRDLVSNLSSGLKTLRYEYLIYRKGGPQTVPEEERNAAIAELRQMGFEILESSGPGKIGRAVTHNWERTSRKEGKARLSLVQSLMAKASGVRENIEVLARSD
jgi:hypothetical protein